MEIKHGIQDCVMLEVPPVQKHLHDRSSMSARSLLSHHHVPTPIAAAISVSLLEKLPVAQLSSHICHTECTEEKLLIRAGF